MDKILILGLLAIAGCSRTTNFASKTPTGADTRVTTTTSKITLTPTPTSTIPVPTPILQPTVPTVLQTLPTLQPLPPLTQKTPQAVAPKIGKQITSSEKFAANIRSSIGCGAVNEEYKTKVVSMAIALTNPKATEQLTEPQFYQAVKQSIIDNQAQANNLVAEFRAKNCGAQSKNINTKKTINKTQKAPAQTDKVILEQSGSCRDLNARGISNINVKINPWASVLDQDKDGIACESN